LQPITGFKCLRFINKIGRTWSIAPEHKDLIVKERFVDTPVLPLRTFHHEDRSIAARAKILTSVTVPKKQSPYLHLIWRRKSCPTSWMDETQALDNRQRFSNFYFNFGDYD
jgi:hypothetical protein